jgi:hypothetical protein
MKASSSRRYQSGFGGYGDASFDRSSTEASTSPYAPATIPATGTPVVGTYDPTPVQGEPLRDAVDDRRP